MHFSYAPPAQFATARNDSATCINPSRASHRIQARHSERKAEYEEVYFQMQQVVVEEVCADKRKQSSAESDGRTLEAAVR